MTGSGISVDERAWPTCQAASNRARNKGRQGTGNSRHKSKRHQGTGSSRYQSYV